MKSQQCVLLGVRSGSTLDRSVIGRHKASYLTAGRVIWAVETDDFCSVRHRLSQGANPVLFWAVGARETCLVIVFRLWYLFNNRSLAHLQEDISFSFHLPVQWYDSPEALLVNATIIELYIGNSSKDTFSTTNALEKKSKWHKQKGDWTLHYSYWYTRAITSTLNCQYCPGWATQY